MVKVVFVCLDWEDKMKLAHLDDSATCRLEISGIFDPVNGVEVIGFPGIIEFHQSEHSGFDCVLLDLNLPPFAGVQTLRDFRKLSPVVPVVVLSAIEINAIQEMCLRDGAQGYLVKSHETMTAEVILREVASAQERLQLDPEHPLIVIQSASEILERLASGD